jgi:hypothetical protein
MICYKRRSPKYGTNVVCADPVTGSSGTCGAKKRDTKSLSLPCAEIIPIDGSFDNISIFGESEAIVSSFSSIAKLSDKLF